MIRSSLMLLTLPLALAGCGSRNDSTGEAASGSVVAPDSGVASYLARFTTTDPATCYGDADMVGVDLIAKQDAPFAAAGNATRVIVAIDGSGSMAGRIGGRTKLELAREATLAFVDGLPTDVEASVLTFGQQGDNSAAGKAKSCVGVDLLTPMSRDRGALTAAVGRVRAVGWTPLAAGLDRAAASLAASDTPGTQIVYVVSDGQETCGGDPVAAAKRINQGNTRAIVNIIGFDLPSADAVALEAVAKAGGGRLVNIDSDAALQKTLAKVRESNRSNINLTRSGNARAVNTINAGAAVTKATICVGGMVTRETLAVGGDLTAREADGKPEPDRRAVMAALDTRHKAMRATLEAYRQRLLGTRDAANDTVDAKEDAAK